MAEPHLPSGAPGLGQFRDPVLDVAFYPAGIFTGNKEASWNAALATPVVATLALGLALCMWQAGIRRYNSTGT